jgi:hypothetical protein
MITITINTANDAFQDDPWGEVASILESIATNMRDDQDLTTGRIWHDALRGKGREKIWDSNGNTCGSITMGDE